MAEAFNEEIRILLIGRTGHGKSTVGNMLLGEEYFKTSRSCVSCTTTSTSYETVRDGIRIVVCDTPGLFDTKLSNEELLHQMTKSILLTVPGFNVIAFVLKPERFTEEMRKTKEAFFNWFGGDVRDYFCIICTHTEDNEELQEFIGTPHPDLSMLLEECNHAIFPFEKKASPPVKDAQVRAFLQHARKIKGKNGENYFTNPLYKMVCKMAEKREKKRQERERLESDMAKKKEEKRQEELRKACDVAVNQEKESHKQERLVMEQKYKQKLEEQEEERRRARELNEKRQEELRKACDVAVNQEKESHKQERLVMEQKYKQQLEKQEEERHRARELKDEYEKYRKFREDMNEDRNVDEVIKHNPTIFERFIKVCTIL